MATATYPNFYESIAEAHIRLLRTVVVYEGLPYKVLAITDHKSDGIFRIYLWPIGERSSRMGGNSNYPAIDDYNAANPDLGKYLDKFIDAGKTPLIRKYMSAAGFNKFRPFPLGMVNALNYAHYIERRPVRRTEQGLTQNMLKESKIMCSPPPGLRAEISVEGQPMRDCILGEYPSVQEVITNLNDPDCTNVSVAFNRNFALVRGPLDTMYVAYKSDVVGLLPYNTLEAVVLGKEYRHLKEVFTELNAFGTVQVK